MSRNDNITSLFKEIAPKIETINKFLMQDRVSYEMILGDIEALLMRKQELLDQNKEIELQNLEAGKTAERIKAVANDDANKYLDSARKLNMEAMRRLEEVKDFVVGVDKKRYQELKKEVAA